MRRPIGVTILAIWYLIAATVGVFGGLFVILTLSSPSALPSRVRAAFGAAMLLLGLLELVVATGLWKLMNWARLGAVVFSILHLLSVMRGLILLMLLGHASSLIVRAMSTLLLVLVAVIVWVLWYLFRPHVKQAFTVG